MQLNTGTVMTIGVLRVIGDISGTLSDPLDLIAGGFLQLKFTGTGVVLMHR
jgi:hypothetical protein